MATSSRRRGLRSRRSPCSAARPGRCTAVRRVSRRFQGSPGIGRVLADRQTPGEADRRVRVEVDRTLPPAPKTRTWATHRALASDGDDNHPDSVAGTCDKPWTVAPATALRATTRTGWWEPDVAARTSDHRASCGRGRKASVGDDDAGARGVWHRCDAGCHRVDVAEPGRRDGTDRAAIDEQEAAWIAAGCRVRLRVEPSANCFRAGTTVSPLKAEAASGSRAAGPDAELYREYHRPPSTGPLPCSTNPSPAADGEIPTGQASAAFEATYGIRPR